MAVIQPITNQITLWQAFSTFDGPIDLLVIYEPTHLKIMMQLVCSSKDLISIQFENQQISMVTRESGYKKVSNSDRASCWTEETVRSLYIPFPTNPKLAIWEESNNILTVTVPWTVRC